MASRTAVMQRVRSHDAVGVTTALTESPELVRWRDERGRGWLHICCMAKPGRGGRASVETADVLLGMGFAIDEPAFTEDEWKATPLWHAVGRGRNLVLVEHLLQLGADPNYCLWAASFNDDLEAIDLLVAHGASLEDPSVPGRVAVHRGDLHEPLRLGRAPARSRGGRERPRRVGSNRAARHAAEVERPGALRDAAALSPARRHPRRRRRDRGRDHARRKHGSDFRRMATQLAAG